MIDQSILVPVKILKQNDIYYLSNKELDLLEQNTNLYLAISNFKKLVIQKYVAFSINEIEPPKFDLDKSLKNGAILIEVSNECFDSDVERVTMTIPKNIIMGIDAISENRSATFTQMAKQLIGKP
jgi:hypothetical protein